ncbi:exopolysaccharide production protein YjbE [Methylobacterium radiotolerans]|uniref:exopolysaccharide production protein YjbE n=1 Tax=Methylobacterium radiotolerans TaxID=31998 RepID=UPI001F2A2B70|nr:exopolysaccharide production protein YjbE [Methylobacterium radiotolerans]UIY44253.1 exopolysaccharide production protein YjbE [Methylobacterium radiotolerans]
MKTFVMATIASLALAAPALAAPCNTGTIKAKDPTPDHVNPNSSDVDKSSQNLAGGQQPASPGTVGAMNAAGANQMVGQKPGSEAKNDQGAGVGTSSKNLAGGQQPASPGTVGAMNNAGANQKLGDQAAKDDGC